MTNTDQTPQAVEQILTRAKRLVKSKGENSPTLALLSDLTGALEAALARQEDIRREAFLDGVRGAAKVVRDKKEAVRKAAEQGAEPGGNGAEIHDEVAERILDIAREDNVSISKLKDLLARTSAAAGDREDLDAELIRVYYALINRHNPSSADVLPLGRPTASVDVAVAMASRLMPNGWWSLGANFAGGPEPATALVGAAPKDEPAPKTGATPPLALLAALLATLIAEASGQPNPKPKQGGKTRPG